MVCQTKVPFGKLEWDDKEVIEYCHLTLIFDDKENYSSFLKPLPKN